MTHYIKRQGLSVDKALCSLIEQEICPGTNINLNFFWQDFEQLIDDFLHPNRELLNKRDRLQEQIDNWHRQHARQAFNPVAYKVFLKTIGYLEDAGGDFFISTENVDAEIAELAGPQLVVPVKNARFALNAVNARWQSLYDALYGSNVISENDGATQGNSYNPMRGEKVIGYCKAMLDKIAPLAEGSHTEAFEYRIYKDTLRVTLSDGFETQLAEPEKFVGFRKKGFDLVSILLKNNGLHIDIQFDRQGSIGKHDLAGIQDMIVESALTTIMDCEDSVAAVDAEDKVEVYRNWLGLMKGSLQCSFNKQGKSVKRAMNPDRHYQSSDNTYFSLPGRSLLFVRNVGHLMTNPAILDRNGQEIPEGILDGVITAMAAIHDLNGTTERINSRKKSIYIVKPKMHGSEEVAFCVRLFSRIETLLKLPHNTLKIGVMDEERRTTVNLKACIRAAKERLVFINTGFLDRTGDEIHTSMHLGPFVPKSVMKEQAWIQAYENWNVDIGLACGLQGRAQIGKGMWPMPDEMADMMQQKIAHPRAGANTAWVPSPTAAALHSLHYHEVNVREQQQALKQRKAASLDDILTIPVLAKGERLSDETIQKEIDNNAQGILGYVVRWIDQGIGCSKVPDINHIGLMEDRATLRISSQYLANWLHHGLCTKEQVMASLVRMSKVVNLQNKHDPSYKDLLDSEDNIAFQAAKALIFEGLEQPSGYTEPLLHAYRKRFKESIEVQRESA